MPLTLELIKRDASVTVCHSLTPHSELERLCKSADYLFVAAGHPHLINASMVKPGAVVINIGTTYCAKEGSLTPDVHPDVAAVASVMTPTPHGVGCLPVAMLCYNTLVLAEARVRVHESMVATCKVDQQVPLDWTVSYCTSTSTPYLGRVVRCRDFEAAVALVTRICEVSTRLDHHPTMHINSRRVCEQVEGCDLDVQLSTYSTKTITAKDFELAQEIDKLVEY